MTKTRTTTAALAAALVIAGILTGCSADHDQVTQAAPLNTTASTSADSQPATAPDPIDGADQPTAEPTAPAEVEVHDGDGNGSTGAEEAAAFGENANSSLVADEMRRFTEQALANQDLMGNKIDLDEDYLNSLALSGRALATVVGSRDKALELTVDTFNGENIRPRAVDGKFAEVVNSDKMKVDSNVIKENGVPVALHAEWTAKVRVYVEQRANAKAAWKPVTYEGSRHYEVRLVLNPVTATDKDGDSLTSVWLVDDWKTSTIRFAAVTRE